MGSVVSGLPINNKKHGNMGNLVTGLQTGVTGHSHLYGLTCYCLDDPLRLTRRLASRQFNAMGIRDCKRFTFVEPQ